LLPPRGWLCRSNPKGREAGGHAGAGTKKERACGEPQDREAARPHRASFTTRPRRRGDRVKTLFRFVHQLRRPARVIAVPLMVAKRKCRGWRRKAGFDPTRT